MNNNISTEELLSTVIEGIRNKKGHKIVALDLQGITEASVDFMVLCEAQSTTQVVAIADEVDDVVRSKLHVHPLTTVGRDHGEWVAIDYGNLFVHVMTPESRAFYDIEHLWADGVTREYNEN